MVYSGRSIEKKIKEYLIYNFIVVLIIVFWFVYSTSQNILILVLIAVIATVLIFIIITQKKKQGLSINERYQYYLFLVIPIYLYSYIILSSRGITPPFFIPFNSLVGIKHNHDFFLILLYFSITILKLIVIKIYFTKKLKTSKIERGDDIFQFFVREFSYKKLLMLILLFPLSAFVEEFIYRSFLISIFTYYFNWDVIVSIIFVSIVFGLVHYSTSKNWGHVISTLISSFIYSFAMIQLGILYPWLFHLLTNLLVLLFYHQQRKKIKNKENSERM